MRNFIYHKELASGGWSRFSLAEQLGNIGSEVSRADNWQAKDKKLYDDILFEASGNINENNLDVSTLIISKVPSLWGPAIIEVRVWE